MATIAVNTSFKIPADGDKVDVVTIVGNPITGDDDVSIWLAATVEPADRVTNGTTIQNLAEYAKAHWSEIVAIGTEMIFHVIPGGGEADIEVNGTPTSDQIRLEIGDTIYTKQNSNHLFVGVDHLTQAYLEASNGN